MSLVKMLNVPEQPLDKPLPRQQLLQRLESLLTNGAMNTLLRAGFPQEPLNEWRVRDLALAVHLLENAADSKRADLNLHTDFDPEESPADRQMVLDVIQDAEAEERYLKQVLQKLAR